MSTKTPQNNTSCQDAEHMGKAVQAAKRPKSADRAPKAMVFVTVPETSSPTCGSSTGALCPLLGTGPANMRKSLLAFKVSMDRPRALRKAAHTHTHPFSSWVYEGPGLVATNSAPGIATSRRFTGPKPQNHLQIVPVPSCASRVCAAASRRVMIRPGTCQLRTF